MGTTFASDAERDAAILEYRDALVALAATIDTIAENRDIAANRAFREADRTAVNARLPFSLAVAESCKSDPAPRIADLAL